MIPPTEARNGQLYHIGLSNTIKTTYHFQRQFETLSPPNACGVPRLSSQLDKTLPRRGAALLTIHTEPAKDDRHSCIDANSCHKNRTILQVIVIMYNKQNDESSKCDAYRAECEGESVLKTIG